MSSIDEDRDGVVDYLLAAGMPLTGIWKYTPNANGPAIAVNQGYLNISRGTTSVDNQWTYLEIEHNISNSGGTALQFDIQYTKITVRG